MEKLPPKKIEKKKFKQKNKNKVQRIKTDKSKRSRLFIKNLPFKITEEEFKSHFEKFGEIVDVKLLKNADGKLKGCGFINYKKKNSAVKAIQTSNNKLFKDRSIQVDWAVPKTKFEKDKKNATSVKTEDSAATKSTSNEESGDECEVMETDERDVKKGSDDSDSDLEENNENSSEDDTSDEEEGGTEDGDRSVKQEVVEPTQRSKVKSNDVSEGKTVFLKNLPFHIDNNRLKQLMYTEFGPKIMYALVCIDKLTEHSKGTAFVKFKTVEDADTCIKKGEMTVDGETVTFHAAMDKKQLILKKDEKQKQFKDSRNLYLVKEGLITAGSRAAEGVSVNDMTKRVQLEQWKTQIMRNLHMFVSKTRLIVHNLPPECDDKQLRALFKKYSPPKAVIREAKVMRNIRDLDEKGVGKSKEHGFVSFTTHEDALQALRNVNNNPGVFTRAKRPIVAFSIENRAILNAKMKRMEKSKEKNPLYREKYLNEKKTQLQQKRGNPKQTVKYNVNETRGQLQTEQDSRQFKGMLSKPTQNIAFAKKHKLTKQLDMHKSNVQQSKKEGRNKRKKQDIKLRTKDPVKTKQGKSKQRVVDNEDKQFSKLISSYKTKISAASAKPGVKKWYDT